MARPGRIYDLEKILRSRMRRIIDEMFREEDFIGAFQILLTTFRIIKGHWSRKDISGSVQ